VPEVSDEAATKCSTTAASRVIIAIIIRPRKIFAAPGHLQGLDLPAGGLLQGATPDTELPEDPRDRERDRGEHRGEADEVHRRHQVSLCRDRGRRLAVGDRRRALRTR